MVELVAAVTVAAPAGRCFDVTRSIEAHRDSSTLIGGRPVAGRTAGLSGVGDETTWSAAPLGAWSGRVGLRFRVRVRTLEATPPHEAAGVPGVFRETRVAGLPRPFGHLYTVTPTPGGTVVEDRFTVGLPWWLGGRVVTSLLVRPLLGRVQRRRMGWVKGVCEGEGWRNYLGGERAGPGAGGASYRPSRFSS